MFQVTPYSIPFAISVVLCLGLAGLSVRHGRSRGFDAITTSFLLLMIGVSIWSIARLVQFSVSSRTIKLLAVVVLYLGYTSAPLAFLAFAFSYTGQTDRLSLRLFGPLVVVPIVTVVLAATNEFHGWLWTARVVDISGTFYLRREFEILFHLIALFMTTVNLVSVGILLRYAITSEGIYRRQAVAFVVGALVPISFAVMFAAGQTGTALETIPWIRTLGTAEEFQQNVDLTPVGLAVMGVIFWFAVLRFRLLDLAPIARDTVVEHMDEGYLVLDDEDRIVDFNPAAASIVGTEDDPIGDEIGTVCPPLVAPLDAHDSGTMTETELTIETDGRTRFFVATLSTLSEDDRQIGRLCVLRDVTERRGVQKRYQTLIEESSDLIYVLDEEGTVKYASPSVERQFGVPTAEIEGNDALGFVHEDDREELGAVLDRLFAAPDYQPRFEYRIPDANGNWHAVECVGRNLLDNPFVEGIVLNARDVTDRKERIRELERTNQRLEEFASVVSHDLRNPLNVAQGHVELAREGHEGALDEIERSHDRMQTIIDEVLTMAQEGQSVEDPEPVDVRSIAETAWENVAAARAAVVVENDGIVEGDETRLLQLFENLFRNAVEHGSSEASLLDDGGATADGGVDDDAPPAVTVRVGVEDGVLYVADDGVGIPEDDRDEVFHSGFTTAEDGTGFGLAIVSEIADAHGWVPRVTESEAGGARFEFVHAKAERLAEYPGDGR